MMRRRPSSGAFDKEKTPRSRGVPETDPNAIPSALEAASAKVTMTSNTHYRDWIAQASDVRIDDEIARRGIKLNARGPERYGPCPKCGGTDRFAINVSKQVWNCRGCQRGGDVISLVQHLDGCTFDAAIATLSRRGPTGCGIGKNATLNRV